MVNAVRVYSFGDFVLDARTGELTSGAHRTLLREQPLQLLLALLEHPGELITREELTSRLWPAGTFVDFDRGLNKAVNHLREALGDSAEHPRFIETLPRKGYRFVAPVTHDAPESGQAAPDTPSASSTARRWVAVSAVLGAGLGIVIALSIGYPRSWPGSRSSEAPQISALAVIPLENLSRDPEQEYFADGMTDALITDLAKMGSLRITSRTSVMRYKATKKSIKEVGRDLNVDAVVEGTVMRSGNRVRITAQLIQVSTDMHLWAENVRARRQRGPRPSERRRQRHRPTDQCRGAALAIAANGEPRGVRVYLKGRYFFHQYTSQGWQQAIQHFNQATRATRSSRPPIRGSPMSTWSRARMALSPTDEALTRGKAAAATALQLDDTLASAHYALATAYAWYDWDWQNAEREFHRAIELNPNDALGRNWHGGYLLAPGPARRGDRGTPGACELDPLSLIVDANLTRSLYWARRYDEAIAQARKTLQLDPHFGVALFWLEGALRHKPAHRSGGLAAIGGLHPGGSAEDRPHV